MNAFDTERFERVMAAIRKLAEGERITVEGYVLAMDDNMSIGFVFGNTVYGDLSFGQIAEVLKL